MTTYKVGYFVGSLSSKSLNRLLAEALMRLAPPGLQMAEIPFKDLPLYSPDYESDYPAVATRRAAGARWRRMRRRSRSDSPPQMPNFSPLARAYSRQSSRTTQPRHTSLASRVEAPRSGQNRSGSTPRSSGR